jgi:immunity protein Imm1 of predicted polymorphic toxin system
MYTISWDSHEERVDSVDDVDRRLEQLHEQYRNGEPTLVTVERADRGDSLSIGLGARLSVLNFVRGDKNPPYYTSAGGRDVDEAISFMFGGEWSEYPLRAAVSIEAARAAMRRFCETGELSEAVVWEEV